MELKNTRLSGLDALRGLAAIGVTCHHLEQSRLCYQLPTFWNNPAISRLGGLCVSFFFVLSGFLITYLFLAEKEKTGRIHLQSFYRRRILRIWPLYFVITALGFFVIPYVALLEIPGQSAVIDHFWAKLGLYLGMSPHLANTFLNPPVPYSAVLWSVGVEEWFYAFWPFIFLLPGQWILRILLALIPAFAFFRWHFRGGYPFYFFSQVRFDCMAIGGLAAFAYRSETRSFLNRFVEFVSQKSVWRLAVLLLGGSIAFGLSYHLADELVYGILFASVMIGAARAGRGGIILDNPLLRFAGRVSYGAYGYNWMTLVLALVLIKQWPLPSASPLGHVLHYLVGFGLTFACAYVSYRWIEQPFLRLKDRKYQSKLSEPDFISGHLPAVETGKS